MYRKKLQIYKCTESYVLKKDFKQKKLNPMLVFVMLGTLRFMKLYKEKFKSQNEDTKRKKEYTAENMRRLSISETPNFEKTLTYVVYEDSCDYYMNIKDSGNDKVLLLSDSHSFKPCGKWESGGMRQVI